MKEVLLVVLILFIQGCEPTSIEKAQQDVVCSEHSGVYRYTSISKAKVLMCNDGTRFENDSVWYNLIGNDVADKLLKD